MTGPCQCWIQSPLTGHQGHCCFGYRDDDAYQRGQPPPCGHWHEDVPRPIEETA